MWPNKMWTIRSTFFDMEFSPFPERQFLKTEPCLARSHAWIIFLVSCCSIHALPPLPFICSGSSIGRWPFLPYNFFLLTSSPQFSPMKFFMPAHQLHLPLPSLSLPLPLAILLSSSATSWFPGFPAPLGPASFWSPTPWSWSCLSPCILPFYMSPPPCIPSWQLVTFIYL